MALLGKKDKAKKDSLYCGLVDVKILKELVERIKRLEEQVYRIKTKKELQNEKEKNEKFR